MSLRLVNLDGASTDDPSAEARPFICHAEDSLWSGIEKALDNGFGCLFVVDGEGVLLGATSLELMRAAIRDGAHLGELCLGDLATLDLPDAVRPMLDARGRVVDVRLKPEARFLPVAEPDLSHAELRNLIDAYLSTWISSTGDYIRSFERRFAEMTEMAHGVATSNGTVSLHLALAALGIGEGDEVIVPDLTFAASANTVLHVGATPVLVDVDPGTWCLSVESIERALTPRTKAIMPVHVFGRPAPMTEIAALAKARGLFIIEDCAEAHGARYDGRPVGSFSHIASFSFFANKIVTTGEGGICLTDDPELAARMRVLRDHGMRPERRYWHEDVGFNFRMTNMQAAVGCAQLERMAGFLAMRRGVDALYREAFAGIRDVSFPAEMDDRAEPVVWFSCALVPPAKRPALIAACAAENIDLRPFFNGLSSMPAYTRFAAACPASASLSAAGVNLPTSRKVDRRMAEKIAGIFRSVLEAG
jgi:perosamine synthetase